MLRTVGTRPPGSGGAVAAALLLAIVAIGGVALALRSASTTAQTTPTLGVDAQPHGNDSTILGPIDPCVSVAVGQTFDMDIFIIDVQNLLAWEIYLEYDPDILEVIDRDVLMFQQANPGSSVYDVSDALPDSDGLYRVAAADTADPPSPDSGSGVLTRLTFRALSTGTSVSALAYRDLNNDGHVDQGPFLRDVEGHPIGASDEDTLFDGTVFDAQVAVGEPCQNDTPVLVPSNEFPAGGDGFNTTLVLSLALGLIAGASALVGAVVILSRRRAQTQ